MKPLRIIFMGTPHFAVPTLKRLIVSRYKIVLVVTQPDKPKGRKLKLTPSPVKEIAEQHNIPCFQPNDINSTQSIANLISFKADIIVTVAYGAILCKEIRTMCPFGAINLHPSLLPKHRGADPIRSTILNGDTLCGSTVFFISAKLDSGNIICQKEYDIPEDINYTRLESLLSRIGAMQILQAIHTLAIKKERYKELKQTFPAQDHTKATYSEKVNKQSNLADFRLDANEIILKIKAYSYEPGYTCLFRNKKLKLLEANLYKDETINIPESTAETQNVSQETSAEILKIIKDKGFIVSINKEPILITRVQYEGKKKMTAYQFHLGTNIQIGERLYNGI